MREIICIQVGNCGNNIGAKFWEVISDEHAVNACGNFIGNDSLPLQNIDVYYNRGPNNFKFVPRAVIIDLDAGTAQRVQCGPCGRSFNPASIIVGSGTSGANIWATGYFTEGAELMDRTLDAIRREAERADCLQGFQIAHAIGGGTGAGMGSLLMQHLNDDYLDRIVCSFSVLPSPLASDSVVEPYNAILTLAKMIQHTHETICVDNQALCDIFERQLNFTAPWYEDYNHLVAVAMAGVTASFRFTGQLNTSLRKLYVNMVPQKRLHFFVPAFAPLVSCANLPYTRASVNAIVDQLFDSRSLMAACDPSHGAFLTAAAIFRGHMATGEVDMRMHEVQQRNEWNYVEWIPSNMKSAFCDIPPPGYQMAATLLGNTTAICQVFERLLAQYVQLYRRQAFRHWFTSEGMDTEDFTTAENDVRTLVDEYNALV